MLRKTCDSTTHVGCGSSLCNNVVLPENELSRLGATLTCILQVLLHGVVELPNGEHTEFNFTLVPEVGVLDVDICGGMCEVGIRVNMTSPLFDYYWWI